MADQTSPVPQLSFGMADKETQVNELMDAASPAMIYGRNAATTTGLTWGYIGGRWGGMSVATSTVALTASNTNYVVVNISTGAVSVSTATTNWNDTVNYARAYKVTTGASSITNYEDHRGGISGTQVAAGGAMTNPMTTAEDIIIGGVSGSPTRKAKGADGKVLGVSAGALAWVDGGLTNPMSAVGDLVIGGASGTPARLAVGAEGRVLRVASGSPAWVDNPQCIPIACSDETTALTAGTAKVTFRMPYAFTLTGVRASLTTAPTGSVLTVDINEAGVSILSTKLTIDATEKTSTTAAAAAVISDAALADDAEITIDIDGVGSTVAGAGLKVYLIGRPT